MPKKIIPPIANLSKDSKDLFDVLNEEKDLPVILIATSFLDACLASILEHKLISSSVTDRLLDSRGGMLGTFSGRADLCYTLGLIDKPLYKDLTVIGSIRNVVAHHHLRLDFSHTETAELCEKLSYVSSVNFGNDDGPPRITDYMIGPRNQFTVTVTFISQRLLLIGLGEKRNSETV